MSGTPGCVDCNSYHPGVLAGVAHVYSVAQWSAKGGKINRLHFDTSVVLTSVVLVLTVYCRSRLFS